MRIASVVGTRPQFVKYAPISRELGKERGTLIHTGQHYDYNMDKIFFDELGIPTPDYNLGIGSGSHAYQTGEMLKGIEDVLTTEKPDILIVFGDTNSTLAGALAAAKLHIKLAHVEAGVRSFDRNMPEEINRVVVDHCADYLFCPTTTAINNLHREGIADGVYLTGDVMVDALNSSKGIAERSNILDELSLNSKQYLVVTLHRASNTDMPQNLRSIAEALIKIAGRHETVVFPVHPRTLKLLKNYGLIGMLEEAVKLIQPLGYLEFLKVLSHARMVLTDSGGIQKEAYMLKVPCITLRENTEWAETVEDGWNILAGADADKIIAIARTFEPASEQTDIFGTQASKIIGQILRQMDHLNEMPPQRPVVTWESRKWVTS